MTQQFWLENAADFRLRPIEASDLEHTAALCDICVGKNLYTQAKIRSAMENRDHYFYLLQTRAGESVGYIYFYLTDVPAVARDARVDREMLESLCADPGGQVCKIQSVAVLADYRGRGLAAQMVRFALQQIRPRQIQGAFAVCWKMGQVVPLEKTLRECGFAFLTEAEKVWFDEEELFCPYCGGRCHCNAEIYYKQLN